MSYGIPQILCKYLAILVALEKLLEASPHCSRHQRLPSLTCSQQPCKLLIKKEIAIPSMRTEMLGRVKRSPQRCSSWTYSQPLHKSLLFFLLKIMGKNYYQTCEKYNCDPVTNIYYVTNRNVVPDLSEWKC